MKKTAGINQITPVSSRETTLRTSTSAKTTPDQHSSVRANSGGKLPRSSGSKTTLGSGPDSLRSEQSTKKTVTVTQTGGQGSLRAPLEPHQCDKCGQISGSQRALLRHKQTCGIRDRQHCMHCGKFYETFGGVRLHERRAHPEKYHQELQIRIPEEESAVMRRLAAIEATTPPGRPFISYMESATKLTKYQIRHKRCKPLYATLLAEARDSARRNSLTGLLAGNRNSWNDKANTPTAQVDAVLTPTTLEEARRTTAEFGAVVHDKEGELLHHISLTDVTTGPEHIDGNVTSGAEEIELETITYATRTASALLDDTTASDGLLFQTPVAASPVQAPSPLLITSKRPVMHTSQVAGPSNMELVGTLPPTTSMGSAGTPPLADQSRNQERDLGQSTPSPPEVQETRRPRIERSTMVTASSKITDDTVPTEFRPRLAESTSNVMQLSSRVYTNSVSSPVVIPPELKTYLLRLQNKLEEELDGQVDEYNYLQLTEAGLMMSDAKLTQFLTEWIGVTFNSTVGRAKKTRGAPSQNTQAGDGPQGQTHPVSRKGRPAKTYSQKYTGSGPRAANFKKAQDLYSKNKKALVDRILSGKALDQAEVYPKVSDVETLFGGILESESPVDDEVITDPKPPIRSTFSPITVEDVDKTKINWPTSAPGLDGISVDRVRRLPSRLLSILFTIIYMTNIQLPAFSKMRTTLVFKEGSPADPSNWRPITVGSALQRLMHLALSNRLKTATSLNANQRGFTDVDGTLANSMILDTYIRERRGARKGYCVVSLDIRKAFDTVSHNSVVRALERLGIDPRTVQYISSLLATSTTTIKSGSDHTRELRVRRGVKTNSILKHKSVFRTKCKL
ncbi:LOW QUALITY PROTEIN: uncharacterized protein [Leptinotarsa decemlineata]|uniref:LOW QUALITY PROTEIN: uncharacterized protein n=1 Tax=Leptinotarsa decemlineata TaxID=7539 RepID=UPI003D30B49E